MFCAYLAKGKKGIVSYHTQLDLADTTIYKVTCSNRLKKIAFSDFSNFTCNHTPCFGKYEVEEFVAEMILISIVKKDITKLMNTEISYGGFPYRSGYYSKEDVRELILSYCNIISDKNGIIVLDYLGKPNSDKF